MSNADVTMEETKQQDPWIERFLDMNPFETFFDHTFGPLEIFSMKLSCKGFKRALDGRYPPWKFYEKKNWIVHVALKRENWKMAAYLLKSFDYHVPEFLWIDFAQENFLYFKLENKEDIVYHDEIFGRLFNHEYSLDDVVIAENFGLFDAKPDRSWRVNDPEVCFWRASRGSVSIMEYIELRYEFPFVMDKGVIEFGTYETLKYLYLHHGDSFRGLRVPHTWKNAKFIIDHRCRWASWEDIPILEHEVLLAAAMNLNDLSYLKKKRPQDYRLCMERRGVFEAAAEMNENPQFWLDNIDLLLETEDPNSLLRLLDKSEFVPLLVKIMNHMEESNIELTYFPAKAIEANDLDLLERNGKRFRGRRFGKLPLYMSPTFDIFRWSQYRSPSRKLDTHDIHDLSKSPLKNDIRFLDWLENNGCDLFTIPEKDVEFSIYLLKTFPRQATLTDDQLISITDLNLIKYLCQANRLSKKDKMMILTRFHSPEITVFLLEELQPKEPIPIDEPLSKGKVWLLDFMDRKRLSDVQSLIITDETKLISDAQQNHHWNLIRCLSKRKQ